MISNPISFHTGSGTNKEFTYEGGNKMYHFSPKENGFTKTMENNMAFFANDEEHAKEVLGKMLKFSIECSKAYQEHCDNSSTFNPKRDMLGRLELYLQKLEANELKISEAPMNQFYMVPWACNDTIH
jgi:hypothetical protein